MGTLTDKQKLDMWSRCPYKVGDTVMGDAGTPVIILDIVSWISFHMWEMEVYDAVTESKMQVVLDKFSNQVLDDQFVEV